MAGCLPREYAACERLLLQEGWGSVTGCWDQAVRRGNARIRVGQKGMYLLRARSETLGRLWVQGATARHILSAFGLG